MKRERLKSIVYPPLIMLIFFAVLEGVCRISWDRQGPEAEQMGLIELDPVIHHKWKAGVSGLDTAVQDPYTLQINNQSWLESYDVSREKPADVYRIFYVGDSNTQGQLPAGQRLPDLMETWLNEQVADRPLRFEVINTGTSSHSPMLYYLNIRHNILPYDPDLVIVNVDMTDVLNDIVYRFTARYDEAGELEAVLAGAEELKGYRMTPRGLIELSSIQRFSLWLQDHSAFYDMLATLIHGGAGGLDVEALPQDRDGDWLSHDWSDALSANVDMTLARLLAIAELLDEHDVGFIFTGVPHYPQYTGNWSDRPLSELAHLAEEHDLHYIDTYGALAEAVRAAPAGTYYWPTDPTHLNRAGNELWAREAQLPFVTDYLHQRDLLP